MIIDNSTGDDLDYAVQDQPIDGGRQRKTELGAVQPGNKKIVTGLEGQLCNVFLTPAKGSGMSDFTWIRRNVPAEAEIRFRLGKGDNRHIDIVT